MRTLRFFEGFEGVPNRNLAFALRRCSDGSVGGAFAFEGCSIDVAHNSFGDRSRNVIETLYELIESIESLSWLWSTLEDSRYFDVIADFLEARGLGIILHHVVCSGDLGKAGMLLR